MKKLLATALAAVIAISTTMTACGKGGSEPAASAPAEESASQETSVENSTIGAKKIVFCKSYANIDENNQRTENAIQQLIKEINAKGEYEIEYHYTDSQAQVDKQLTDVESLLQYKPDIILISSVDTVGSLPALEAAKATGAFVVEDRGAESDAIDAHFFGSNEDAIAARVKTAVKDYLDANPDITLNFGLCYGMAAQIEQLKRCDAIKELAEDPDYGKRVNVIAEQYCDWSTDKSTAAVEDWMTSHPELNAVMCASDDMGLGACNALTAGGRENIFVGAVDGTAIGVQLAAESPQYYITVAMSQIGMQSALMNDIVIGFIDGSYTGGDYYCDESCFTIVNRENVDNYVVD